MTMEHEHHTMADGGRATVVLHVGGLRFATEAAAVERAIGRHPGVVEVLANPSAQTATVTYDPARCSAGWRSAVTTAPASRCPFTSANRWTSRRLVVPPRPTRLM